MGTFVTNTCVRLRPGRRPGSRWFVTNLENCVSYETDTLGALVLAAFFKPSKAENGLGRLEALYGLDAATLSEAFDRLAAQRLIVDANDQQDVRARRLTENWWRAGWIQSADYHLAVLDYPFVDYASDGKQHDERLMKAYAAEQPDTDRSNRLPESSETYPVLPAADALQGMTATFGSYLGENPTLQVLDQGRLFTILSSVFGVLRRRPMSNDENRIASGLLKTSPSGGGRHPTECYLFALSVDGVAPGVYYFDHAGSQLIFVRKLPAIDQVRQHFSGPFRAPFEVDALLVLTSVFARNRYRYREPRTFRTIFHDVGHLIGTLDVVSKSIGVNCLVQHGLDEVALADVLDLNLLDEGVIYGAALGGSR